MAGKNKSQRHKTADEKPYRVGYGHPPLGTRFKPNQSGNPKGRPRQPVSLSAVVEKVMEEKVEIRQGERVLRMSNRQALVRAALRRALNGDPRLLRTLALLMRAEAGSQPPEQETAARMSLSDEAILADYLARYGGESGENTPQGDKATAPPPSDQGSCKS
jgi:hypothetical protein